MSTSLAAKPTKSIFDPFNSSATGHQRAENRLSGSTSWRDSRSLKLREQFSAGHGGGKRLSDTVGAGGLGFGQDGRNENGAWEKGAEGLRTGGQKSLWECMGVKVGKGEERPAKRVKTEEPRPSGIVSPFTPFRREDGKVRKSSWTSHEASPSSLLSPLEPNESDSASPVVKGSPEQLNPISDFKQPSQIFKGLTIYINGSTAPAISDHMLKRLLSTHGAHLSIALGRRTVTHVIIGRPASASGAGGGLAGSKIQKEIARMGGKAVKFVVVQWVLESIKAGKRLPESRFEGLRLAPKGIGNAAILFAAKSASGGKAEPDVTLDEKVVAIR